MFFELSKLTPEQKEIYLSNYNTVLKAKMDDFNDGRLIAEISEDKISEEWPNYIKLYDKDSKNCYLDLVPSYDSLELLVNENVDPDQIDLMLASAEDEIIVNNTDRAYKMLYFTMAYQFTEIEEHFRLYTNRFKQLSEKACQKCSECNPSCNYLMLKNYAQGMSDFIGNYEEEL